MKKKLPWNRRSLWARCPVDPSKFRVEVVPDRTGRGWSVGFACGVQGFRLETDHETEADAKWTAKMLRKALRGLQGKP